MQTTHHSEPWHRQSAMRVVTGVLIVTVLFGAFVLKTALSIDDPLVMDDRSYQELRDDFRVTKARPD